MKRVGERGSGQWERVTWDEALADIADRFIDTCVAHGPESVTFGMGSQMAMKRASMMANFRFTNISGSPMPEAFAGVGDLPTGVYLTLGEAMLGDTAAAIFKSRTCLIWYCNPAVTRIPDAHFFWEARYNGTEVIAISPEFTPTAMHASKWAEPEARDRRGPGHVDGAHHHSGWQHRYRLYSRTDRPPVPGAHRQPKVFAHDGSDR